MEIRSDKECVVCRERQSLKGLSKGLRGSSEHWEPDTSVEVGSPLGWR